MEVNKMREIRFKVWDTKEKKWVNFSTIEFNRGKIFLKDGFGNYIDGIFQIVEYTELYDRNGRLIYEGDILENRFDDRGVVVKEDACWTVEGFEFKHWYDLDIIGNIYDNPELLEG